MPGGNNVTGKTTIRIIHTGYKHAAYCYTSPFIIFININTLRTGEADLRFYVTTVQDG